MLDVGLVVVGVELLGPLLPPPHATVKTSIAPPPKSATAVLAPDFIFNPQSAYAASRVVKVSYPGV